MRYFIFSFSLCFLAFAASAQENKSNECPAKCREITSSYQVKQVKEMNDEVNEASGLEVASGKNLWTHGDGGTGTELYKLSPGGKLLEKIKLEDVKNNDWEDLARDRKGNLYIGDFGNNKSERKDLQIVIVPEDNPKGKSKTIKFSYADQKVFPPAEGQRQFDTEAFFWRDGNLYLFNKNIHCRDYVRVYQLPDKPGKHTAVLVDSILLNSQISSADLSPDGKTVVLLGLEELYLLEMDGKSNFSNGRVNCLKMPGLGKTEGVTFMNSSDMLVCNENGMIYAVTKKSTNVAAKNKAKAPAKRKAKKA